MLNHVIWINKWLSSHLIKCPIDTLFEIIKLNFIYAFLSVNKGDKPLCYNLSNFML